MILGSLQIPVPISSAQVALKPDTLPMPDCWEGNCFCEQMCALCALKKLLSHSSWC